MNIAATKTASARTAHRAGALRRTPARRRSGIGEELRRLCRSLFALVRVRGGLRTVLLLVFALLLAGCGGERPPASAASAPPLKVRTAVIEAQDWEDAYEAPGAVRARYSAAISSKVVGYVREMRVSAGDRVKAGQVLAVLAAQDLDAQVARANAGRTAAQHGVVEAEKARAAAESTFRLAEVTYQRYQSLLARRSVSRQEFDETEARYHSALAGREMSEAAVARARAVEAQAGAEAAAARVTRGYATLTAPFSGIVTEKHADAGALALPGQPLLVIEQAGDFRLEAAVEESRAGTVRLGQTARVSIDALGATVEGRVVEIVPAVETSSRSFIVKVDLPRNLRGATEPAAELRSGMFGRAWFPAGRRQAVAVPLSAVQSFGQLQSVYVVEDGVARQRLVTLGSRAADRIEVLSGLNAGERIVLTAAGGLRDGRRVEEAAQ